MDPDDQRDLVQAARTGDADAWERLYRAVYPRLRAYAVRRAGAETAEDIVSETMTRAVAAIHRYQWQPVGFDAWVFGIARRVTADHHRQAARRPRPVGDGSEPFAVPGEALELAEEHAQLHRLFERLSPAEQELLELRVVAGLNAEQTAAALGKRPGAVRMAQSRALAHLRALLERDP